MDSEYGTRFDNIASAVHGKANFIFLGEKHA